MKNKLLKNFKLQLLVLYLLSWLNWYLPLCQSRTPLIRNAFFHIERENTHIPVCLKLISQPNQQVTLQKDPTNISHGTKRKLANQRSEKPPFYKKYKITKLSECRVNSDRAKRRHVVCGNLDSTGCKSCVFKIGT